MPLSIAIGLAGGALIAVLTVLAEHSRIELNHYALYGNGALVVPSILVPYALYPGWVWIQRHGGRALELALFVVGLHFGVGAIALLEVLLYPSETTATLFDALPGVLLSGAIFVLPAALLAAGALWLGERLGPSALVVLGVAAILVASFLAVLYGAGLGLLSGGAVALARRAPERIVLIGVLLLVLTVVVGNIAYLPAILA